jgi:16S rRNA (guanine527-N7)-methyltransferase
LLLPRQTNALLEFLATASRRGFIGPGPAQPHLAHALGMATVVVAAIGRRPTDLVDLGSGAGVPGLVLAVAWEGCQARLLEAHAGKCRFLRDAIAEFGLGRRVTVIEARAEVAGRDPMLRGAHELVVARAFGAPAVTAELGAPLLVDGGHLIVSEPPEGSETRWPAEPLLELGLVLEFVAESPVRAAVLHKPGATPARYPRRTVIPGKRPLW